MLTLIAASLARNPIAMMFEFLVFCCVVAVFIILVKWVLGLTGIVIPPPLLLVAGIIVFLILLTFFLDWTGIYSVWR